MFTVRTAFFAMVGAAGALPASADLVQDVRLGVLQHNICVSDCKNADKEDGPTIEGEIRFSSPGFLSIIFKPKPYVLVSANASGATSYVGAGLSWNWDFAQKWSLEPSFGYAIHDGAIENPFPRNTPENADFLANNVLLGSEDLFRSGLALNRDFGKNWGVQIQYEHLSHGQILGEGRNQGLDSIGVRGYYRFGG